MGAKGVLMETQGTVSGNDDFQADLQGAWLANGKLALLPRLRALLPS